MYLVSQSSCLVSRFNDEEAVRRLAKAGFDGIDFRQAHAPFHEN